MLIKFFFFRFFLFISLKNALLMSFVNCLLFVSGLSFDIFLFLGVLFILIICFMSLQENIRRCVCIIYDPSKSNQGVLALKALKLSDSFMELYRSNNFTGEKYVPFPRQKSFFVERKFPFTHTFSFVL